jgi:hypothetical protein
MSNNGSTHGYSSQTSKPYYMRIQQETSSKVLCTSHKVILRKLSAGTYAYCCGKKGKDGLPMVDGCSDVRSFIVRTDDDVNTNGYSFVHTSDQQGFNWDEYEVWRYAAETISNNEKDIQFIINTGDATQNGNRINEWLDYFNGRDSLKNYEEMYTIGNNDLCPVKSYEEGDGQDTSKINSVNITYFYTFELDEENMPVFSIDGKNIYVPSLYSFNYGNSHFMCLNSEICDKTEELVYLLGGSGKLYSEIKKWCDKDIENYKDNDNIWKIAYCHEMPFTILTAAALKEYYDPSKGVLKTTALRGGSRINTNLKTRDEQYWFSKFCQDNGIRLVMGGHKHTQSISWPLIENHGLENGHSMQPTIQVTQNDLSFFDGSNKLTTVNSGNLAGCSYPNKWFNAEETDFKDDSFRTLAYYCKFVLVTKITAPVYSMSQATGYKHTSNKELPAPNIPWLKYYYPLTNGAAHSDQKMPFYTHVNVKNDSITLYVKRLYNIMNSSGKFNINVEGNNLKNGQIKVTIKNGIAPSEADKDTKYIITK